jgi:hypothetical protein
LQGEKMDYTVAVDSTGQAAQALLGAAGVSGIPHAFIIDRSSRVRHHGHPMEPAFAAMLDTVCGEAAAAGGGGGGAGTAPQRELPPVTSTREELAAMPVRGWQASCSTPAVLPHGKETGGGGSAHSNGLPRLLSCCMLAARQPSLHPCLHTVSLLMRFASHSPRACAAWQVRQLKQILGERGIGLADLNEKAELVQRILERCANVTYYSSSSPAAV